jgi:hypothetical protein
MCVYWMIRKKPVIQPKKEAEEVRDNLTVEGQRLLEVPQEAFPRDRQEGNE